MKTLTHQDKTFCYKTVGNKNHPCLVLVMGITGQLINWPDTLLQGLADSGFYVVVFDNRDVGLSQYYDHLPTPSQAVMEFFFNGKPPVNQEEAIERHVAQYKLYNHPDDFNPEGARALQERAHTRAYHPEGNHRQLLAMICAQPRGESLKTLNAPTVIVHGDCDPVFNLEHAKRLQSCIAGSRLVVIENLGHGLPKRMHPELIEARKTPLLKGVLRAGQKQ